MAHQNPEIIPGAKTNMRGETNDKMSWYAVHTYSGLENRAKKSIEESAKKENLDDQFGMIVIPTEVVKEMKEGDKKPRDITKKIAPGYIFVQMEMNEKTFLLVKNTAKVTGFVGGTDKMKPKPVPESQIVGLTKPVVEPVVQVPKAPVRYDFEVGDQVTAISGPFEKFSGVIEEVKHDKQKVRVQVTIFGRSTPVDLDFSQIQKLR